MIKGTCTHTNNNINTVIHMIHNNGKCDSHFDCDSCPIQILYNTLKLSYNYARIYGDNSLSFNIPNDLMKQKKAIGINYLKNNFTDKELMEISL